MAKLGDSFPIGTEHVIDGTPVIVEEAEYPHLCDGCVFYVRVANLPRCIIPLRYRNPLGRHNAICYDTERSDEKHVIFRRKEKLWQS